MGSSSPLFIRGILLFSQYNYSSHYSSSTSPPLPSSFFLLLSFFLSFSFFFFSLFPFLFLTISLAATIAPAPCCNHPCPPLLHRSSPIKAPTPSLFPPHHHNQLRAPPHRYHRMPNLLLSRAANEHLSPLFIIQFNLFTNLIYVK